MFKKYLTVILTSLVLVYSCQQEESIIIDEVQEENLTFPLVNLLTNLASNDGSIDNIIDGASCIEIELPVNVVVNGLEITIDSHNDLQIIEAIFDNQIDDEDLLEIVFPITITLPDFTTIDINNDDELLFHSSQCNENNIPDEDIECLDFIYPITFSLFNTNAVAIDTEEIFDDQALHDFLNTISENVLASLNYPVQVVLWDGSILSINSQNELEIALEVAQDACDEDDDNDYNDDDNINLNLEELTLHLTACPWEIETLVIDTTSLTDELANFYVDFNENFTISLFSNSTTQYGTWSIVPEGNSFRISIDMEEVPNLSNDWLLHTIEEGDNLILDLRYIIDIFRLKEKCNIEDNDAGILYTFDEVTDALETCEWVLDLNENGDFFFYDFTFNSNGSLTIANLLNGQVSSGNWGLEQLENGEFEVTIQNLNSDLNNLEGNWIIQDFTDDFIVLQSVLGDVLTMSQTCPNDLDLTEVLLDDNWRISYFELNGENQTSLFSSFIFDFDSGNQVFAIENGVNGALGTWQALNNDLGMSLNFGPTNPLFNLNSNYWIVLDLQSDRVELVYQNGQDLYVAVFQSN